MLTVGSDDGGKESWPRIQGLTRGRDLCRGEVIEVGLSRGAPPLSAGQGSGGLNPPRRTPLLLVIGIDWSGVAFIYKKVARDKRRVVDERY